MLYLFQSKQVETVREVSTVLGKSEATIHRWLSQYRKGGLENLLKIGRFSVAQKVLS
jgi:transposase